MSKGEKRKALAPRLRFPEFSGSGNWTYISVGTVLSVRDDRQVPSEDTPLFSLTIEDGITTKSDRYNREFLVQNGKKKYKLVRPRDIVYNPANLRWGAISASEQEHNVVVSPIYEVLYITDLSSYVSEYVEYSITRREQIKLFAEKGQGTLVERIAVNIDDFRGTLLPVPATSAEQQKIADCLGSLDDLIAAQRRKLAALRDHKKGLMQQLFPREGKTRPRLRFPEFKDTPEWEMTTIGEHVNLLSGFPFDGKGIVEDNTGVPLMRGINITEGRIRHDRDYDRFYLGATEDLEKYRLREGDLVIGMDGSKVGKNSALISSLDARALLVQRVARLRSDRSDLMRFIFHLIVSPKFHSYVDRINTSSGIPHISAKQIKEFSLALPSDDEQHRIANCLSALDAQITAQAKKVDALRTHKRGLMQRLFPAPEGA